MILVGERLAEVPGALAAAARLADATGARLAWIPRRAGERGAIEAGRAARPAAGRPPGGRPDGPRRGGAGLGQELAARRRRAATPRRCSPPPRPASSARCSSPGVDPADLPDPAAALRALDR